MASFLFSPLCVLAVDMFLSQCVAGLEMVRDLVFSENPSEIFRDACYIRNGDVPPFVVVLLSVSPGSD